jgi:hypothetical protein
VTGRPEVLAALERVIGGAGHATATRVGLPADADRAALLDAASRELAGWQRRAESPMSGRELVVAARVAVRSCEGMIADLTAPGPVVRGAGGAAG